MNFIPAFYSGCKEIPVLKFGPDVNLSDAVFVQCDLSQAEDLTLEQVKTTWNFKNNRMSLCKWPKKIEKELGTEYFGDPISTEFCLDNPTGIFHKTMPETICLTGQTHGLLFSSSPQPNLYYENANFRLHTELESMLNVRYGLFLQCKFSTGPYVPASNFRGIAFVGCQFHIYFSLLKGKSTVSIDITDSVFIDCDLSESTNLTLEQVKSTWNYKTGRMNLSKWPEEILKALEEEEKAKEDEK